MSKKSWVLIFIIGVISLPLSYAGTSRSPSKDSISSTQSEPPRKNEMPALIKKSRSQPMPGSDVDCHSSESENECIDRLEHALKDVQRATDEESSPKECGTFKNGLKTLERNVQEVLRLSLLDLATQNSKGLEPQKKVYEMMKNSLTHYTEGKFKSTLDCLSRYATAENFELQKTEWERLGSKDKLERLMETYGNRTDSNLLLGNGWKVQSHGEGQIGANRGPLNCYVDFAIDYCGDEKSSNCDRMLSLIFKLHADWTYLSGNLIQLETACARDREQVPDLAELIKAVIRESKDPKGKKRQLPVLETRLNELNSYIGFTLFNRIHKDIKSKAQESVQLIRSF